MADFTELFESGGLTAWTEVNGPPFITADGYVSPTHCLLVDTTDGVERDIFLRNPDMPAGIDPMTGTGYYDEWYYYTWAIFVPDWGPFWNGGSVFDPYCFGFTGFNLNIYLEPKSASSGVLELNWGGGNLFDSESVPAGQWVACRFAIMVEDTGTGTIAHSQFWIDGATGGPDAYDNSPAYLSAPAGIGIGDDAGFGGMPEDCIYYIDDVNFSFQVALPDVDLTGAVSPGGGPVVPCSDFGRFYEAPLWRGIITNLSSETLTFLDRLATDIEITPTFLAPHTSSARVPSDNPEINILADEGSDSEPFLAEGNRLVYWFRRDCGSTPWVIREAGIILTVDDSGDSDAPDTVFNAFSPWAYLHSVPIREDDGDIIGQAGKEYTAGTRWDEIVIHQLTLMALYQVGDPLANAALDWGQTAFYNGTIEATDTTDDPYVIQQGKTIGDLFDDLVSTGEIEIVETAIYDPVNRPGFTHELSIYNTAGDTQYDAIFSWDMFPRSCVGINRVIDGRERINYLLYGAGQGATNGLALPRTDAASVAKYGNYFREQFFPGITSVAAAYIMAGRTLTLQADGQFTYRLSPSASRAPIPLVDYNLGDFVPVYASRNLRDPIDGELLRVQSIPIRVGTDQLERVDGILVSSEVFIGS